MKDSKIMYYMRLEQRVINLEENCEEMNDKPDVLYSLQEFTLNLTDKFNGKLRRLNVKDFCRLYNYDGFPSI